MTAWSLYVYCRYNSKKCAAGQRDGEIRFISNIKYAESDDFEDSGVLKPCMVFVHYAVVPQRWPTVPQ